MYATIWYEILFAFFWYTKENMQFVSFNETSFVCYTCLTPTDFNFNIIIDINIMIW